MAFRIVVTDTAKQELENALERLAVEFESPNSASRLGLEFKCLGPVPTAFPPMQTHRLYRQQYIRRRS